MVVATLPTRFQRKRERGWRSPRNSKCVGRGSKYGNPFPLAGNTRANVIAKYARYLGNNPKLIDSAIADLGGKHLGCWCQVGLPCHADLLLLLANPPLRDRLCQQQPHLNQLRSLAEVLSPAPTGLRLGTFCSGLGTAERVAEELGWTSVFCSEIDKHANALLAHRYPGIPNLGDMWRIDGKKYRGTVDVLIAGTSCQGFSVAGDRTGLAHAKSILAIRFVELLAAIRPKWFVWENVPGVFSCNKRQDFTSFLGWLTGRGIKPPDKFPNSGVIQGIESAYSIAWRVLDAQYFGVPQRRRRVFVVGYLGSDWRPPFAVLNEPYSLSGFSKASQKAQEKARPWIAPGDKRDSSERQKTLPSRAPVLGKELFCFSSRDNGGDAGPIAPTVRAAQGVRPAGGNPPAIAWCMQEGHSKQNGLGVSADLAYTITTQSVPYVWWEGSGARKLTPVEVERLFGLPDNYTNAPYRKKGYMPDYARYKMLGNAIAYPVLKWIGDRLQQVEEVLLNG